MYFFFFYKKKYFNYFFFFFQAEDGIRDYKVTGVQTCALPISAVLFRTVTLALGTVAPDGSLINPEMVPRSDCANNAPELDRLMKNTRATMRHAFFMLNSL